MNQEVKKKIVKAVVWSLALYGSETWTLRKEDIQKNRSSRNVGMEMDGANKLDESKNK